MQGDNAGRRDLVRALHGYSDDMTDILAPMQDNQTFYECGVCHKVWEGPPTPGVLHKYIVCRSCAPKH